MLKFSVVFAALLIGAEGVRLLRFLVNHRKICSPVIILPYYEKTIKVIDKSMGIRKGKHMKIIYFLTFCISALLLAACNQNQPVKDSQLALMKTTNPSPIVTNHATRKSDVDEIKKEVSEVPEIYDVAVVKGDKDTLVAYKVKHLHRFKMKKIESNVNKQLEEQYPKENFTVSSDYKVFLEAVRLNEHMKSHRYSHSKAESRLKELVKMTEDLK